MGRIAALALAWVGTVAAAWYLGGGGRHEPPEEPAVPVARAPEPTRPAAPPASSAPVLSADDRPEPPAPAPAPAAPPAFVIPVPAESPATIDLSAFASPEEAMGALMAWARARLAEGESGHLEILRMLERLQKDKAFDRLFGDGPSSARYLYPWVRFLVENDGQVAALTETVFRTLAEEPEKLGDMDDDAVEPFTEGVAMMLPAVVSEERMARLREWARRIAETPEGSQPKIVEQTRRDAARALAAWTPAATPEQALELLKSGRLPPAEAVALLRRIPAEALSQIDLVAILGPVVEQMDWSVMRTLASLPLDRGTIAALDQRIYRSPALAKNPWMIGQYLRHTGREKWADARPFVEAGLRYGGATTETIAGSLLQLSERPPTDFVREVVERYPLSDGVRQMLRANFGLDAPAPR
jgi:hypothetical protein